MEKQAVLGSVYPLLIRPQAGYEIGGEMSGFRLGTDMGYFALTDAKGAEDVDWPEFDGADMVLGGTFSPSRPDIWTAEAGVTYKKNVVFYSGGIGLGLQFRNNPPYKGGDDTMNLSAGLAINGTAGLLMDVLFIKGKLEFHPKADEAITAGVFFGADLVNGLTALSLILS